MTALNIAIIVVLGLAVLGLMMVFPIAGVAAIIVIICTMLDFWKAAVAVGIIGLLAQIMYDALHDAPPGRRAEPDKEGPDGKEHGRGMNIGEAIAGLAIFDHFRNKDDK